MMWSVLNKLFVRSYYQANAGFFLFFFFVFFGAVNGSSLVSYHLSLMNSILGSPATLLLVLVCWLFYHVKCTRFFLRFINSEEGKFLISLQAVNHSTQWFLYLSLYLSVYSPVFVYALLLVGVGYSKGLVVSAMSILLFQFFSTLFFTGIIYYRLNHWLEKRRWSTFRLPFKKSFFLLGFFFFIEERKNLLLLLKLLSFSLLYIILVWNRGKYDNDAFLFFYLVLLLAHAALPFFAVQFWEKEFALSRNLPVSLSKRAFAFLLPYLVLLLPECIYIFVQADAFAVSQKIAYCINLLASLSLLTALQYSEAQSRDEYMKATFAIVFLSIFLLHIQAYWLWIAAQFVIAAILFVAGFYKFELEEEE